MNVSSCTGCQLPATIHALTRPKAHEDRRPTHVIPRTNGWPRDGEERTGATSHTGHRISQMPRLRNRDSVRLPIISSNVVVKGYVEFRDLSRLDRKSLCGSIRVRTWRIDVAVTVNYVATLRERNLVETVGIRSGAGEDGCSVRDVDYHIVVRGWKSARFTILDCRTSIRPDCSFEGAGAANRVRHGDEDEDSGDRNYHQRNQRDKFCGGIDHVGFPSHRDRRKRILRYELYHQTLLHHHVAHCRGFERASIDAETWSHNPYSERSLVFYENPSR